MEIGERIMVADNLVVLAHIDLRLEHNELVFLIVIELDVAAVIVVWYVPSLHGFGDL